MSKFRVISILVWCLWLVLATTSVRAEMLHDWTIGEIAAKSDILVTGEVVEIKTLNDNAHYGNLPVLRLQAKIRVLRAFSNPLNTNLQKDQYFSLEYRAIDSQHLHTGVYEYPGFPHFVTNHVYVFPLNQTGPATTAPIQENWQLISAKDWAHDESIGLIVPALKETLPDAPIKNGFDFLRAELAGDFAFGDYKEVFGAANYLSNLNSYLQRDAQKLIVAPVFDLVAHQVGTDQAHWVTIAVASYCAISLAPHATVKAMLSNPEPQKLSPEEFFSALALRQLHFPEDDTLLINEAIQHMAVYPYNTAQLLIRTYPYHPAVIKGLTDALNNNNPAALLTVTDMIKDNTSLLLPPALKAAQRYMQDNNALRKTDELFEGYQYAMLRAAVHFIAKYGSDSDFKRLFSNIEEARRTDRKRFAALWGSCDSPDLKRAIPLCRLAINDHATFSDAIIFASPAFPILSPRRCDYAAERLQSITGVDFGLSRGPDILTIEQRNVAVGKAKSWLWKHPTP